MELKPIRIVAGLALSAILAIMPMTAGAQDLPKVRFAHLKTLGLITFFYGVSKGYFRDAGVEVDMIAVPGGPAVGAAVASGSADIGASALSPVVIARDQGQPFKFFMSTEWERTPDQLWGYIIATGKSGIKSLKDLKGRNVAVGPPGGLCELAIRDWMKSAGASYADARILNNPFPQMPAMLELGTADAACIVEPFAIAALQGKANPVLLGRGYLSNVTQKYRTAGLFATDAWIASHRREIAMIKKAYVRAASELRDNAPLVKEILAKEYRFPPAMVDKLKIDIATDLDPVAADYKVVLDKLAEYKMISKQMKPEDIIATAR